MLPAHCGVIVRKLWRRAPAHLLPQVAGAAPYCRKAGGREEERRPTPCHCEDPEQSRGGRGNPAHSAALSIAKDPWVNI